MASRADVETREQLRTVGTYSLGNLFVVYEINKHVCGGGQTRRQVPSVSDDSKEGVEDEDRDAPCRQHHLLQQHT